MMNKLLAMIVLLHSMVYANFNFESCSGAGTFEQEIVHYNGYYTHDVLVGEIPQGIQNLKITLISDKDVDIRLYAHENDAIVSWPYGALNHATQETLAYEDSNITYSGYNGVDNNLGHEFIEINGTTSTIFTMKVFGYKAGYASVNYSWTGKEGCTAKESGSGSFEQDIALKDTTLVGTIPSHVNDVNITLTSTTDLDLQLYAEDGTAIARWQPSGLMSGSKKQSIMYKGMHITWSGYNGINNQKGHEFIQIIGTTTEMLVLKVYGYVTGVGQVIYNWGLSENIFSIKGAPNTTIEQYKNYEFTPVVNNPDIKALSFKIENKPSWAEFNTTSGRLFGVPSSLDDGNYSNIVISVDNGTKEIRLEPFSIDVKLAIDIAYRYGKARQGTGENYQYYAPASNAIDHNDSTYNFTRGGKNGENWLEIELPNATKVRRIVVQNKKSYINRIKNAQVYLLDNAYEGNVTQVDSVYTLKASAKAQIITLDPPVSARYVLIKGEERNENDRHIQLLNLEVYGDTPQAPVFNENEDEYLISGNTSDGVIVAKEIAIDFQEDNVSYSIIENVPFMINTQGEISVNGNLTYPTYVFHIHASDGTHSSIKKITMNVTSKNAIEVLIQSGDVENTLATEDELIEATLKEIEQSTQLLRDAKIEIFNLNVDGTPKADSLTSLDWFPTWDSCTLIATLGENSMLLESNAVAIETLPIYKKALGVIGERGLGRYVVMASNPLRNAKNNQMETMLENTLAWLTKRKNLKTDSFSVVLAHLDNSYYFRDETKTREWLDAHYANQVSYNVENTCDGMALEACLDENPDLLIISQVSGNEDDVNHIAMTVKNALGRGIPVLYVHHDGNLKPLGRSLFTSVFDVKYEKDNRYMRLEIQDYNPSLNLSTLPVGYQSIQTMFTHFKQKDYSFDWSVCEGNKGAIGENYEKCHNVIGLDSEFQDGATFAKEIIDDLDNIHKNIFLASGYRIHKLLVLTADKFRQSIHYPMDKVASDTQEFMKAYYADHVVYSFRKINPAQRDMGNFSRSDFSHITPVTKTVTLNSKKSFRSTGVYMLPGQTMRIVRNDNSDVKVNVFVNTLRSQATHHYAKQGYKRPKYLRSQPFELIKEKEIELTSPYGGLVQLGFSKNDLPVSVTFENVGEHPYWSSASDNASFTEKMNASEYDWAEISTAGFEVHSTLEKMKESIADPNWGTAELLAEGITTYTSNYPHVLAGFKGEGIDVIDEIHAWANEKNVTIETMDIVKHMNADQATCGYGCGGNPYDAYWAFNPIGHGDIHELGHFLQKKRFEGFPNHSATNTFSYYTKSRYFENTGNEPTCQGLDFKKFFNAIQSSVGQEDIVSYLKTNLWDNATLSDMYLVKIQAMMHAQKQGKLKNGWHVLARVHILEREMQRAKKDWESRKDSVGFSTYSLEEINSIRANDWLIIAYSYAAELDFRNYFDMMGIPHSDKAYMQIESFGFDVAPNELFVSTPEGYCKSDEYGTVFDRPTLKIDGNTSYPY